MSKIKQQKHIATAQKQLQKAKEKSLKYVPGTINLQILGNGAKGAPSSVYLFTDQSRYFSNWLRKLNRFYNLLNLYFIGIYSIVVKGLNVLLTSIKLNWHD